MDNRTERDRRKRLAALRRELRRRRVASLLVIDPVDIRYLIGFTGDSSWLLVWNGKPCLVTDSRFSEQAERECRNVTIKVRRDSMLRALAGVLRRRRIRSLGFEPAGVSVLLRSQMRKGLKNVRLVPVDGLVGALGVRKDESELRAIRKAVRAAEKAWREFRKRIRPGMTEQRLAAELDYQMRLAGAESEAFPTILAVDGNASMPHARPGTKRLRRGSVLLVDFGAKVDGYVCDLTRVLWTGRIPAHIRRIYDVVLKAQAAAIAKVKPGAALADVDAAARDVIEAAGFGKAFTHGTGHGMGRRVHEAPWLRKGIKGHLEPRMVVTIEPAVYVKGRFGIRIEDDVLVTKTGHRVLTHVEKDPASMAL